MEIEDNHLLYGNDLLTSTATNYINKEILKKKNKKLINKHFKVEDTRACD